MMVDDVVWASRYRRAPRTPEPRVDARTPGSRTPGAASSTMWSPSDERGVPMSPPRDDGAASTSAATGNAFTHEEKHAQALRAGEARRTSSFTARETILEAVRQMMDVRAKARERDGRDLPPVDDLDDDDLDDGIVRLKTSRGSLFSVDQIREWRRQAVAAQVVMRWRAKRTRESTWSFVVEDGVRHTLGMPPAPDPDDSYGVGPVLRPPSDEGYARTRSGYAPHVLSRGGAVAWFPRRMKSGDEETSSSARRGDEAREPWEVAADEHGERERLPYVTATPGEEKGPPIGTPAERRKQRDEAKERNRVEKIEKRAKSVTFVAKAVSVVSAFSPFKKAASSVGAFKESAEDIDELKQLSAEEEGARIMRNITPGRNGIMGALADQRRAEREANIPLAMKLAGAAAERRERDDAARRARDAIDGKVTAASRVFNTTRGWRFTKEQIDSWRDAAVASDVRMRWKRRKRKELTFAWKLEEAARSMLALGPNVEDMRVDRVPGRKHSRNVFFDTPEKKPDAARYEHVSDASLSRGAFVAAPIAHKLPRVDQRKVAAPAELSREERRRIIDGETDATLSRTRAVQQSGDFKSASKWRLAVKVKNTAAAMDAMAVTKGGVYYSRMDRDLPLRCEPKEENGIEVDNQTVDKDDPYSLEGRRCVCETTDAIVSGPGDGSGHRGLAKAVRRCPVHFPFGWHSEHRPPPRPPPSKTHGITDDVNTGGGLTTLAGGDDAGYVLYQTSSHYYLASHDYSGTRWRLAKIHRRCDSLQVVEDENEYSTSGVKALMSAVHRGNEQTGGAEVITRGAGVVAFVQLSATREADDPAGAGATSAAAAIARAEFLHKDRAEDARRMLGTADVDGRRLHHANDNARWEERAETRYAGGHVNATSMDATLVFSGCDAVAVNRRGRTRSEVLGVQSPPLLAEVARATRALMFEEGDAEVLPLGHRVAPAESEFATLDPGETLVLGSTHVKRLTVGHLTSTEPVRRLGLGRDKNAVRIGCGVKKCVGGCRGGWAGIVSWGGACHSCGGATREDADDDDDEQERSLRELARLEDESTLEAWFGRYVWRGMDDDSDDEDALPTAKLTPGKGRKRGSDPTLIKLRFRRYQAHVPS